MDFIGNLFLGVQTVFTFQNLLYCFIGVFIGNLIGVLPGIGPVGTISLLLPITYGTKPVSAIIMLSGIYYGAMYGGTITSILVNIPGEAASIVTTLDGYQMTLRGRAGPALGIAAFGSFIAGTFGVVILMFLVEPLSEFALKFGPPEFFSLMIFALTTASYLSQGSKIKAFIMAILGICLSQIGLDPIVSKSRFTFGITNLLDGIGLIPLVMGLFGISEVLINLEESENLEVLKGKIKNLLPSLKDWKDSIGAIIRGTFLGFFLGILPGGGATLSSFVSYTMEKKISKHPERFGKGAIEGVAGPESANNSAVSGAFVPLFTLGLPANAVMALLLGALMIHGLTPGPFLIKKNPDIFWGTIVSMYIGNILLLVLNVPLIGLWVRLLRVPYKILFPFILFFCLIGSYSLNSSVFDIVTMIIFGVIGYIFKKLKYEPAPLVMAFILGPLLENYLRQSLLISSGNLTIFIIRPISVSCLITALLILVLPIFLKKYKHKSNSLNSS
jgi:putative tricarboxylic transport membrane protein